VEDNRTTIKQGNNIRILTYITIAYLPLGFVASLFSISHGSFMDNATNALYAVLTVVFVVGTYGLALSLETILEQWKSFRRGEWQPMAWNQGAQPGIESGVYKIEEEGSSAA
jgi:hypothetical protein